MFVLRFLFPIVYSIDPADGGTGGAPAAPVQPPGQGEPSQGDFWATFPDVPEEHRPIIEPHLRRTQGEITRLQQAHAALKPVIDSGYQPQQLQGLVQFDQRFQQQPLEVFMDMAKMLQDQKIIGADLDLDVVRAVAMGQEVPEEPVVPDEATGEIPPAVQAYIDQLRAELDQVKSGIQQQSQQRQEAIQDSLLKTQQQKMRAELQKVGYSPEYLTDRRLNAALITNNANVQAAIQDFTEMRNGVLKGFTDTRQPTPSLETRNGGPNAPAQPSVRDKDDPWARARIGATNRLKRANQASAQG